MDFQANFFNLFFPFSTIKSFYKTIYQLKNQYNVITETLRDSLEHQRDWVPLVFIFYYLYHRLMIYFLIKKEIILHSKCSTCLSVYSILLRLQMIIIKHTKKFILTWSLENYFSTTKYVELFVMLFDCLSNLSKSQSIWLKIATCSKGRQHTTDQLVNTNFHLIAPGKFVPQFNPRALFQYNPISCVTFNNPFPICWFTYLIHILFVIYLYVVVIVVALFIYFFFLSFFLWIFFLFQISLEKILWTWKVFPFN